jgi:segregation and condensation protein A
MAATLIELKTKMLLPRDPLAAPEDEEDPRTDLVNQLLEYQKYKAAAQMLWSKATVEQAVFKRAELETDKNNPEVSVGLFDLLKVFQDILARHKFLRGIKKRRCSRSSVKRSRWRRCSSVCAIW